MVLQYTATYVWRTLAAHKSSTSQRVEAAVWRIGEVVDYQHISGKLSHLDTPNSCLLMYLMYCHTRVYLVLSADISDELSHLDTPNLCLLMSLVYCHTPVYLVLSANISGELSHLDTPNSCLLMSLVYCHTRMYFVLSADISDELLHLDTPSSCLLMSLMYCHNQVYLVLTADISDELSHLGPPRQPIDHTRRNPITWVFSRSVIRQWVRWQSCSLCYLCEYDMI